MSPSGRLAHTKQLSVPLSILEAGADAVQAYIGYDVNGTSVTNQVVRDNCIEGEGYCVRHPRRSARVLN